ncbi:MAG: hypothetical protein C5B55_14080 [Blastocatellia bacterium]|nr:MAG: hypothetical protein C5B55_14080 [Blastocatellia bacterium]
MAFLVFHAREVCIAKYIMLGVAFSDHIGAPKLLENRRRPNAMRLTFADGGVINARDILRC